MGFPSRQPEPNRRGSSAQHHPGRSRAAPAPAATGPAPARHRLRRGRAWSASSASAGFTPRSCSDRRKQVRAGDRKRLTGLSIMPPITAMSRPGRSPRFVQPAIGPDHHAARWPPTARCGGGPRWQQRVDQAIAAGLGHLLALHQRLVEADAVPREGLGDNRPAAHGPASGRARRCPGAMRRWPKPASRPTAVIGRLLEDRGRARGGRRRTGCGPAPRGEAAPGQEVQPRVDPPGQGAPGCRRPGAAPPPGAAAPPASPSGVFSSTTRSSPCRASTSCTPPNRPMKNGSPYGSARYRSAA